MNDQLENPALKEWAAIWDAVVDGRQIVDLRKGGIREDRHRFRIRATRFWLYDSYEHQRPDLLRESATSRLVALEAARPAPGTLRFGAWAQLAGAAPLTEPEQLAALDSEFIWTPDYAEQRLKWRPKQPLWLLILRAYRLHEPVDVPLRDEYAGCASWVPMHDLPEDPAATRCDPVLSDEEFARRFEAIRATLPGAALEADVHELVEAG